jgi:hypothetical protein
MVDNRYEIKHEKKVEPDTKLTINVDPIRKTRFNVLIDRLKTKKVFKTYPGLNQAEYTQFIIDEHWKQMFDREFNNEMVTDPFLSEKFMYEITENGRQICNV